MTVAGNLLSRIAVVGAGRTSLSLCRVVAGLPPIVAETGLVTAATLLCVSSSNVANLD